MALQLDHTIVPAHKKEKSAAFIARILGVAFEGSWRDFAPVRINDVLTLDFADEKHFESHHYAFLVSDREFDDILQRLKEENQPFGSTPNRRTDGEINHLHQGRGFYFECEDGHIWEVITHTYVID